MSQKKGNRRTAVKKPKKRRSPPKIGVHAHNTNPLSMTDVDTAVRRVDATDLGAILSSSSRNEVEIYECDRTQTFRVWHTAAVLVATCFVSVASLYWDYMVERDNSNSIGNVVKDASEAIVNKNDYLSRSDSDAMSGSMTSKVNYKSAPKWKRQIACGVAIVFAGGLVWASRWFGRYHVARLSVLKDRLHVQTYAMFARPLRRDYSVHSVVPRVGTGKQTEHWAQFEIDGVKSTFRLDLKEGVVKDRVRFNALSGQQTNLIKR